MIKLLLATASALFFVSLALTITMYVYLSTINLSYLSDVSLTWKKGLITDVQISNSSTCDESQGFFNLIQSYWPGTVNGCNCSSYLKRGACSRGKYGTEKLCQDIPATSSLPYLFWEQKAICGRSINSTYFDLNLIDTGNACPENTTDCGEIDTLKNHLCVTKSDQCPITSLQILKQNATSSNLFKSTSTLLPLNINKTFAFSHSLISGQSFVEFKVDEDIPCIFTDHYHLTTTPYILSAMYDYSQCLGTQINNFQTDTATLELDSMSKLDFYVQNGVENMLSQLPRYEMTDATSLIKLYSKSYTGLSVYCRSFLTNKYSKTELFSILSNTQSNIDDAINKTLAAMIYNCIMISLLFAILIRFYCTYSCSRGKFQMISIDFELACLFVLGMGCLIFNTSASGNLNEIRDDLEILGSEKCGDQILIDVVSSMFNSVNEAAQLGLASGIIGGILLAIPGIAMIFKRKLLNRRI